MTRKFVIQHKRMSTEVYENILKQIVDGKIEPGTKLREMEIAEKMNVSRIPIREAFTRLSKDGLIEIRTRRGAIVKKWGGREVKEIYQIRQALECLAIGLSTPFIPEKELLQLKPLLNKAESAKGEKRLQYSIKADLMLHKLITKFCNNGRLVEMLNNLRNLVHTFIAIETQHLEKSRRANREHRQILDVLFKRDACSAKKLLYEHIEHAKENIIQDFFEKEKNR